MSSPRELFREEAFARRGRTEALDGLLRVTAPHEWVILVGLALALLGVLAWGLFGRIDRSLSSACLLARPGERHAVVSGVTGNVVAVAVDVGGPVEAGEPVAYVVSADTGRHAALARARVEALEAADAAAPDALALARLELAQLEALQASGEAVVSPYGGEVAAHDLAPGRIVTTGAVVATVRDRTAEGLEVLAFMPPERAERLAVGMAARVSIATSAGGGERTLSAEVRDVSPRAVAPPGWVEAFGLAAPARSRTVRLSLTEPAPAVADGAPCSLTVILRSDPPVRLVTGRS